MYTTQTMNIEHFKIDVFDTNKNANHLLPDGETLYRVMPVGQFLVMLESKKNTLVSPTLWEDPYENIIKNSKVNYMDNQAMLKMMNREVVSQKWNKVVDLNWQNWYGQCWTHTEESDALWRSFTHNKEVRCVKIKTSINKLKQSIESYQEDVDCYMCDVQYITPTQGFYEAGVMSVYYECINGKTTNTIEDDIRYKELALLLTKREAFRNENEFRMLAYKKSNDNEDKCFNYDIDPNALIEEIEFDPWVPEYQHKAYKNMVKMMGYQGNIEFSKLYANLDKSDNPYIFFREIYSNL